MADEKHEKHGEHGDGGHGDGGHGDGGHGGPPHEDHEEHEGVPEWMVSFADNVALMMGFFVILLAMNMGPKGSASGASKGGEPSKDAAAGAAAGQSPDMLDFALAVREAFNNPVDVNSTNPREALLVKRLLERERSKSEDDGPVGDRDKSQSLHRGDYHAPAGVVSFERTSTTLGGEAMQSIDRIAEYARGLKLIIEIRGHSSADEAYNRPDDGMRLSFERALAVGNALASRGLDWKQMRLMPCGDKEILDPRAHDRQAHSMDERVDIIVTEQIVQE